MPITLTIKHVPDEVAERLRSRAAANRRSLQRELLLIVERAAVGPPTMGPLAAEPIQAGHGERALRSKTRRATNPADQADRKLTLAELWQRARKLGAPMPEESADIVRRDRDASKRR